MTIPRGPRDNNSREYDVTHRGARDRGKGEERERFGEERERKRKLKMKIGENKKFC